VGFFPSSYFPKSFFPASFFPGTDSMESLPPASPGSGYFTGYRTPYRTLYFPGAGELEVGPPTPPIVFDNELAVWLKAQLGVIAYPVRLPQNRTGYPLLTYTLVDGDSELNLAGPCGLAWGHYQFDAYSPIYADAYLLMEKLRLALAGYRGAMGRATVRNANRHRMTGGYDVSPDGSDTGMYRVMNEYTIWYDEVVPTR
jgi:hypothetical protein